MGAILVRINNDKCEIENAKQLGEVILSYLEDGPVKVERFD